MIFRVVVLTLFFALGVGVVQGLDSFAPTAKKPLPAEQAFIVSSHIDNEELVITIDVADYYYLYKKSISLRTDPGSIAVAMEMPGNFVAKDDPLFGNVDVYTESVSWKVDIGDVQSKAVILSYQGCWEGGLCYPVQKYYINLYTQQDQRAVGEANSQSDGGVISLISGGSAHDLAQSLAQFPWWLVMILFFVAGLLLAFTPCVLPMVPIVYGMIVQKDKLLTPLKASSLVLVYVIGMTIVFSLFGVIAALFGANLQAHMQHPILLIAFAILLFLLAGGMFGWYQLQMPLFLRSRLANTRLGSGYGGAFVLGALSVLIVGPCVTPPLVAILLFISQTGDVTLGAFSLMFLSLGMGVPLIAIAFLTTRVLPQTGAWMVAVKGLFGFLLLTLAVYMLARFVPEWLLYIMAAFLLLAFAASIRMHNTSIKSSSWRVIFDSTALFCAFVAFALVFAVFNKGNATASNANNNDEYSSMSSYKRTYSLSELQGVVADARMPSLVYITADWCVSCKVLEKTVFSDSNVIASLRDINFVIVDVTENNANDQDLQKNFGVIGPPTFLFFDSNGGFLEKNTIVGEVSKEQLLARLQFK